MRANPAFETIRSLMPGLAAVWLAGCLYTIEGDPEDGGQIGAGTMYLSSATFTEDGIDPPDDDEENGEPDAGPHDFGEYCSALVDCICEGLEPVEYDLCLEAVADLSEDQCEQVLQDGYPECLP